MKRGGFLRRHTPLKARKPWPSLDHARTTLKVKSPLKRSKPMRRKRARRIAKMTDRDRRYVTWIHTERCCGGGAIVDHVCGPGDVQQSHIRDHTGLGLKSSPTESVPMCKALHEDWEQRKGVFAGWSQEERVTWFRAMISVYNALFEEQE